MHGRSLAAALAAGVIVSTAGAQVVSRTVSVAADAIEHRTLDQVRAGQSVRVENLEIGGDALDLVLNRVRVLTDDAEIWVGTDEGPVRADRPDIAVFSGVVAGEPGSIAYLAVSPHGTNGFIDREGGIVSISTGAFERGKDLAEALRAAPMDDLLDPFAQRPDCGFDPGDEHLAPFGPMLEPVPGDDPQQPLGAGACQQVRVAMETDYEFTDRLFGGDTDASAAYVVSLIGAVSEIYQRDVNTSLAIPFLRVWASNADPYSSDGDPLEEVRDHWNASMGSVDRTVVHYLTGKTNMSYGGVAYLSVLCNENFGYGVSGYLNGFFPSPVEDHNGSNWDVIVSSHELGHNFGTGHTHDSYTPVIDGCGNGDCSDAFGGTVMSYCHTCSGGTSNIVLGFHPRVQDVVESYLSGVSCDISGEGVAAANDAAATFEGSDPIIIDVLANDAASSCESIALGSVPSASDNGATLQVAAGAGQQGRDAIEYTPAPGFSGSDSFAYTITGASGADTGSVSVEIEALSQAVTRVNPVWGLRLRYYGLPALSELPDFGAFTPSAEEVTTSIDYASTNGDFANSGLDDDVGAVFDGYVRVFEDGIHTFSTESDDGSKLYVDDQLVVDNNGIHAMIKRTGTIALEAGWHTMRIEFFERGGGAGIISTLAGPQITETTLSGIFLSHESDEPCSPADLNADGAIDFSDLNLFTAAFQSGDPTADLSGNGSVGFEDLNAFVAAFSAGCP